MLELERRKMRLISAGSLMLTVFFLFMSNNGNNAIVYGHRSSSTRGVRNMYNIKNSFIKNRKQRDGQVRVQEEEGEENDDELVKSTQEERSVPITARRKTLRKLQQVTTVGGIYIIDTFPDNNINKNNNKCSMGLGTCAPTPMPSVTPTTSPTLSFEPTNSLQPSISPTSSSIPSISPTSPPSATPTMTPTSTPSSSPTEIPTASPSNIPSSQPSITPSELPTATPSIMPTSFPTISNAPTPYAFFLTTVLLGTSGRTYEQYECKEPIPSPDAADTDMDSSTTVKSRNEQLNFQYFLYQKPETDPDISVDLIEAKLTQLVSTYALSCDYTDGSTYSFNGKSKFPFEIHKISPIPWDVRSDEICPYEYMRNGTNCYIISSSLTVSLFRIDNSGKNINNSNGDGNINNNTSSQMNNSTANNSTAANNNNTSFSNTNNITNINTNRLLQSQTTSQFVQIFGPMLIQTFENSNELFSTLPNGGENVVSTEFRGFVSDANGGGFAEIGDAGDEDGLTIGQLNFEQTSNNKNGVPDFVFPVILAVGGFAVLVLIFLLVAQQRRKQKRKLAILEGQLNLSDDDDDDAFDQSSTMQQSKEEESTMKQKHHPVNLTNASARNSAGVGNIETVLEGKNEDSESTEEAKNLSFDNEDQNVSTLSDLQHKQQEALFPRVNQSYDSTLPSTPSTARDLSFDRSYDSAYDRSFDSTYSPYDEGSQIPRMQSYADESQIPRMQSYADGSQIPRMQSYADGSQVPRMRSYDTSDTVDL